MNNAKIIENGMPTFLVVRDGDFDININYLIFEFIGFIIDGREKYVVMQK